MKDSDVYGGLVRLHISIMQATCRKVRRARYGGGSFWSSNVDL
jgi:hypothetical protein